jgi:O-antigen/teichoic acid export membrane protein
MKELLSKGILLFIAHIIVSLTNLIMVPIILRLGSVEALGSFSIYSIIISFVYGISSFGVGFKARRFLPSIENPHERAEVFYPQFIFQLISLLTISIVLLLFWKPLAQMFGIIDFDLILNPSLLMLYMVSLHLFSQFSDYYRYTHRTTFYALTGALNPIFYILMLSVFVYFFRFFTINILFFLQGVTLLIIGIILCVKVVKEIGFSLSFPSTRALYQDFKLGVPLTLTFIIDILLSSSDRFIIGKVINIKAVGYYIPAYSIGMLILIIPKMLGVLIPPILARDIDLGKRDKSVKLISSIVKIFLLISMSFISISWVLAKPLLTIYTSEDVANHSWVNIPIVSCGAVFYGLILICSSVLNVEMRTSDLLKATILAAIINISLNIVLLSLFKNIIIPAITTFIAYGLSWFLIYNKIKSNWNLGLDIYFFIKLLIISILVGITSYISYYFILTHNLNTKISILVSLSSSLFIFTLLFYYLNIIPVKEIFKSIKFIKA